MGVKTDSNLRHRGHYSIPRGPEKASSMASQRQTESTVPGRSIAFRLWQLLILFIRSITPLAYIYLIVLGWCLLTMPRRVERLLSSSILSTGLLGVLTGWMLAESIWFPYYLFTIKRLQAPRPPCHAASDPAERELLVEKCMHALALAAKGSVGHGHDVTAVTMDYFRVVMEGWFLGANYYSIKKENIKTWVAWAFMDQDLETLDEEKVDEVEKLVSTIERYSHHSFPPGRNDNIRCIRLNIDAMQTTHRPWIYYAVCKGIGAIAHICVRALGYYQRSIRLTGTAGDVATFWYRPATRPAHPSAVPVVFIHGIGIGFCQYLAILAQLPRNVPVYLLEWAHVSMQLSEEVPTIEHTLELISCVLTLDSVARACFVAHSLGTVAVSWIIHSSQHSSLVASAVLLDPVNLLLCDPKVAFNFLYRTPANSLELAMNYFVSREMYIANALSRHFHWSRNIMFYDDLPKCENGLTNVVMLSDLDSIVPSERVKAYLEASAAAEGGKGKVPMELIYHTNQHHGQILIRMDRLAEIAKHVGRACGATAVETEPLQSVFAG